MMRRNQKDVYQSKFDHFFFQAEDGIRVLYVTGVQTCALPISPFHPDYAFLFNSYYVSAGPRHRSEERRVGKECRSRGAANQQKKNIARILSGLPLVLSIMRRDNNHLYQ